MSHASGGSDTPQRNWNNIPDLLRAMPVNVSVKGGSRISKFPADSVFFPVHSSHQ